jgi:hypothetical protein
VNLLRENGLLLLQQMADFKAKIPTETWLAWLDEGHFLCFQPESGAICGWLELLYWRSLTCESSFPPADRSLAWVDQLPPAEICWWYVADRLGRLSHKSQSAMDARAVKAIVGDLMHADERAVQGLLQSLVDFYDLKARWRSFSPGELAMQQQRAWLATGRRLVEDFLDWEATGFPGIEVFGPIVRVAALELLEPSSGR